MIIYKAVLIPLGIRKRSYVQLIKFCQPTSSLESFLIFITEKRKFPRNKFKRNGSFNLITKHPCIFENFFCLMSFLANKFPKWPIMAIEKENHCYFSRELCRSSQIMWCNKILMQKIVDHSRPNQSCTCRPQRKQPSFGSNSIPSPPTLKKILLSCQKWYKGRSYSYIKRKKGEKRGIITRKRSYNSLCKVKNEHGKLTSQEYPIGFAHWNR